MSEIIKNIHEKNRNKGESTEGRGTTDRQSSRFSLPRVRDLCEIERDFASLRELRIDLKERITTRRNLNFDKKMKNSVSDRSFYIESSDDEDLEKELDNGEDNGNESDSSGLSMNNQNHKQSSSYNTAAWPRSYRFYPSISSASNLLRLIVRLE
ncbi:Amino acid transporter AVT1B, partial [Cucurbita argyrosperma subsp. argyrosperma]